MHDWVPFSQDKAAQPQFPAPVPRPLQVPSFSCLVHLVVYALSHGENSDGIRWAASFAMLFQSSAKVLVKFLHQGVLPEPAPAGSSQLGRSSLGSLLDQLVVVARPPVHSVVRILCASGISLLVFGWRAAQLASPPGVDCIHLLLG